MTFTTITFNEQEALQKGVLIEAIYDEFMIGTTYITNFIGCEITLPNGISFKTWCPDAFEAGINPVVDEWFMNLPSTEAY